MRSAGLAVLAVLLLGCSRSDPALPVAAGSAPSPAMSPEEVVRTVTAAMQHNDTPAPDSGIATAFRFASPANRSQTGPLEHFIPMVKSPAYAPLLNCKEVALGMFEADGTHARQLVTITTPDGDKLSFVFGLTKQSLGEYKDCWMTDLVMPVKVVAADAAPPATTQPNDDDVAPAPQPQRRPPVDDGAKPA